MIQAVIKARQIRDKLKRDYYRRHFYLFNKDIIGWPDIYEPLHKRVCDFIQDNIKKKKILLLLPRGTFKSSIVTVGYPLWRIAKNPNDRGLISNATYNLACDFVGQVKKNLQFNENYRQLYGDFSTEAPIWRENAFQVNIGKDHPEYNDESFRSKAATLTALGAESGHTGTHFNYAILDDLVARENISTMDRIQKIIDFYKDVLDLVDVDESGHKQIIIIGTTWHQADLYSWIQDDETGISDEFAILKLPAYGNFDDKGEFHGEWGKGPLLFPPRLDWKIMEQLKNNQELSHFSAQYLLNPVPPDNATFSNFKYYDLTEIKGLRLNKFIAIDPAIAEKKESDYSAMVCVGVDHQNNWYLLDIWRGKVNPMGLIKQIMLWDSKWKPITTAIESTAFQRTIRFFLYEEMKKLNHTFPVKELKHTDRTKEQRIESLEPRYRTGSVLHDKGHPLEKYLRDELRRFPKGKNDDLIDALASINEIAFPPKRKEYRKDGRARRNYPA